MEAVISPSKQKTFFDIEIGRKSTLAVNEYTKSYYSKSILNKEEREKASPRYRNTANKTTTAMNEW